MVPEGRLHMRPFQFHLKEHWRFPQSLDSLLPWTKMISAHLDWLQNPANVMKGSDLHPKDHSIQLFTDASNEGWGAHLDQSSTKGLLAEQEKRLHINVLELKAVSLALRQFKDQCQNQTVLVATDNSTVVAYINKQGGTHSAEMCALLWKIMTWCHHYVHPTGGGGGHIIFAFSVIRRPASGCLVSAHLKEKYLSYLYQICYGGLLG